VKPKSRLRKLSNRLLHLLARFSPGATTVRPFLHRLRGVKIHDRVFIGDEVYIESEYPECVEIHDDAQIGIRVIIMAHTRGPGKVLIGKSAYIGPNTVILGHPGRTLALGEGCVVAASSVVTTNLAAYTLARGNPAVPVARVTVPLALADDYDAFIAGLMPLRKAERQTVNVTE
jgi:acetyltransferase-like isoleucine patch superfamily enzyme